MFRVRLINKIIGPSNGVFPVCGKSTKLYGHASYMPEHGGPVLDMSLEDYDRDKFDIIGNKVSGQQWVPQFYEHLAVSDPQAIGGLYVPPHPGRAKLAQFNELRKRAKAAGVWKSGMKLADVERALSAVAN